MDQLAPPRSSRAGSDAGRVRLDPRHHRRRGDRGHGTLAWSARGSLQRHHRRVLRGLVPQRIAQRKQQRLMRRLTSDERGVALVEFALVLPILLLILFGVIEFGKAFTMWIDETHLANA